MIIIIIPRLLSFSYRCSNTDRAVASMASTVRIRKIAIFGDCPIDSSMLSSLSAAPNIRTPNILKTMTPSGISLPSSEYFERSLSRFLSTFITWVESDTRLINIMAASTMPTSIASVRPNITVSRNVAAKTQSSDRGSLFIWAKADQSPILKATTNKIAESVVRGTYWAYGARKNKMAKHYFNYEAMKDGNFPKDFIKKPHTQMRSVWVISTPQSNEKIFGKHPTQKPLALLERIIEASTKENDLILDPFMGSGTTGVAALKLNRRFVGIDVEKQYVDLAEKRISAILKTNEITEGNI